MQTTVPGMLLPLLIPPLSSDVDEQMTGELPS